VYWFLPSLSGGHRGTQLGRPSPCRIGIRSRAGAWIDVSFRRIRRKITSPEIAGSELPGPDGIFPDDDQGAFQIRRAAGRKQHVQLAERGSFPHPLGPDHDDSRGRTGRVIHRIQEISVVRNENVRLPAEEPI